MKAIVTKALFIFLIVLLAHFGWVLLWSGYLKKEQWEILSKNTSLANVVQITTNLQEKLPYLKALDPNFKYGFCRYDLNVSGLLIEQPIGILPTEFIIYNHEFEKLYHIDQSFAHKGVLRLYIFNNRQLFDLQDQLPEIADHAQFYKTETAEGIILARIFASRKFEMDEADEQILKLNCAEVKSILKDPREKNNENN